MHNGAFLLRNGEITEEVDAIRLTIGAGPQQPGMRRSCVWKFRSRKDKTDFFVTSDSIQGEMKGTIHRTRAHFGFSDPSGAQPKSWTGSPLGNRHLHVVDIRDLRPGDYQHVMRVSFPGFALLPTPLALKPGKPVLQLDPPQPGTELTVGATIVEGDWRRFSKPMNGEYVGLLTGDSDRYLLISITYVVYEDPESARRNMNRNLGRVDAPNVDAREGNLGVLLFMDRAEDQPITMIELNGVRRQGTSTT